VDIITAASAAISLAKPGLIVIWWNDKRKTDR